MMSPRSIHHFARYGCIAVALLAAPAAVVAAERLTVVELFTSQGCSSCPPANENLIRLKDRPGVLALSFGVTYWDYLGWKDIFARPEFTDRQIAYESGLGHTSPFTPQMVVNGRMDTIGNRFSAVETVIRRAGAVEGPEIDVQSGNVSISAGPASAAAADIWLVHYDPRTVEVPVGRGENTGRTLPHANVVHDLARIGSWNGSAVELALPPAPEGLSTAVLVQLPRGGAILGAARHPER
jgi:hypothetical protein